MTVIVHAVRSFCDMYSEAECASEGERENWASVQEHVQNIMVSILRRDLQGTFGQFNPY